MMVHNEQAANDAQHYINRVINKLRTGAKAEVIVSNGRTFDEVLHHSSGDADLIFIGMAEPDENFTEYYETIQNRINGLPTTIMVLAGEEISFGEVLMQQDAFEED